MRGFMEFPITENSLRNPNAKILTSQRFVSKKDLPTRSFYGQFTSYVCRLIAQLKSDYTPPLLLEDNKRNPINLCKGFKQQRWKISNKHTPTQN